MVKKQVKKKPAAAAKTPKKKTAGSTRAAPKRKAGVSLPREKSRENTRCRVCRVVDGYFAEETNCRFCGAKLFKGDIV